MHETQNGHPLPKGWEWKKLGEVVNFEGGSQPPKEEFSSEPKNDYVRLIQIRDYKSDNFKTYVNKKSVRKFCDESDVMIGRYGPPVFQILRGLSGAYNVALMKAIPNENLLSKEYLFRFLQENRIQNYIIGLSQRSAGQSGVDRKALDNYIFPLPPLAEQQRIVHKLDAAFHRLDEAIRLQQQNLARIATLKKTVLEEVFGNGDIKTTKLEKVFKIKSGTFLSAKLMIEGEFNVFGGNGVSGTHNDFNLDGDHIIIGRVGAQCGNVRLVKGKKWVTDNAFYISEIMEEINLDFLTHQLSFLDLNKTANQAAQPVISYKGIKNLDLLLPSLPEQEKIVARLDATFAHLERLHAAQQARLTRLEALKGGILQEAFEGKL